MPSTVLAAPRDHHPAERPLRTPLGPRRGRGSRRILSIRGHDGTPVASAAEVTARIRALRAAFPLNAAVVELAAAWHAAPPARSDRVLGRAAVAALAAAGIT